MPNERTPVSTDEQFHAAMTGVYEESLHLVTKLSEQVHARAQSLIATITLAFTVLAVALSNRDGVAAAIDDNNVEFGAWVVGGLVVLSLVFSLLAIWPMVVEIASSDLITEFLTATVVDSDQPLPQDALDELMAATNGYRAIQYHDLRKALKYHSAYLFAAEVFLVSSILLAVGCYIDTLM